MISFSEFIIKSIIFDVIRYIHLILCRYLAADCNYGGRVFDSFDRRLLKNLLKRRFNVDLCREQTYQLSESGMYKVYNDQNILYKIQIQRYKTDDIEFLEKFVNFRYQEQSYHLL